MADLIERDAVLREAEKAYNYEDARGKLAFAIHAIKNYPAVNRWISCSERLPEPLQNVIVCTDIKTVTVAWINGDCWHFADTGNGRIEFYGFDEVTHWMPLPEPPESEVQDAKT